MKYVSLNGEFDYSPWFNNFELDRKSITIINRIKSYHTRTKAHLLRMNVLDSDQCECGGIETIDHLIWECPKFAANRESFIKFMNTKGIMRYDDVCKIFNSASMSTVLSIVDFIIYNKILV